MGLTLSAVVPATDGPESLPRSLRSIRSIRRAAAGPEELIVVQDPDLSAVEARNAGASRARGDVLVFVDADVEVHPDAFARLRAAFEREPEVTAVFGSYDDAPPAPGIVSAFRNLLHHQVHQSSAGRASTFWTGLGAIRREAFEAVGGFDAERFSEPSVEDIDLGMRLAAAGAWIELDPEVKGTHLKSWTLRQMICTDFARRGVPWVRLQLRAGRPSTALNLGWRHRVSAAACLSGAGAPILGQPLGFAGALASLTLLVALNLSLYALMARRLGPLGAVAVVPLHAVHHLTAVAAFLSAAVLHLADRAAPAETRAGRGPDRGDRTISAEPRPTHDAVPAGRNA